MKKIFLTMALVVTAMSASAQKQHTIDTLCVTTTPQMHCSSCESKIKTNLRFVKGIKKIETSVPQQKVTLVYDSSKSDYQTFVAAFKKIGYEVKKVE